MFYYARKCKGLSFPCVCVFFFYSYVNTERGKEGVSKVWSVREIQDASSQEGKKVRDTVEGEGIIVDSEEREVWLLHV